MFTVGARDRVSVVAAAQFAADGSLVKGPAWSCLCEILTGNDRGVGSIPAAACP